MNSFESFEKLVDRMINLLDDDKDKPTLMEFRRLDYSSYMEIEDYSDPHKASLEEGILLLEHLCLKNGDEFRAQLKNHFASVTSSVAHWIDYSLKWGSIPQFSEENLAQLQKSVEELRIMADDGTRQRLIDKLLISVHSEARVYLVPQLVRIITQKCRIPLNPEVVILLENTIHVCIRIMNAEPCEYSLPCLWEIFEHISDCDWHCLDTEKREEKVIRIAHSFAFNFRIRFLYEFPQLLPDWSSSRISALRKVISCFLYFNMRLEWSYSVNVQHLRAASQERLNEASCALAKMIQMRLYKWHQPYIIRASNWLNKFLSCPQTPFSLTVQSILLYQKLPVSLGIFNNMRNLLDPYLDIPQDYVDLMDRFDLIKQSLPESVRDESFIEIPQGLFEMELNVGPNRVFVTLVEEFVASMVQETKAIDKGEYIPPNPFFMQNPFFLLFEILLQVFHHRRYPKNLERFSAFVKQIKEYCRGPFQNGSFSRTVMEIVSLD